MRISQQERGLSSATEHALFFLYLLEQDHTWLFPGKARANPANDYIYFSSAKRCTKDAFFAL